MILYFWAIGLSDNERKHSCRIVNGPPVCDIYGGNNDRLFSGFIIMDRCTLQV